MNPNAPSSYRNAPAPRQPTPTVSVPTPEKKILSIVDPETNEEVQILPTKPHNAAQPANPVRAPLEIPPRTSKALELVPDPADAPEPSPASENKLPAPESSAKPSTEPSPKPSTEPSAEASPKPTSIPTPSPPVLPQTQQLPTVPSQTPKQEPSTTLQAATTVPVPAVQDFAPQAKSSNIAPTNTAPVTSSEAVPAPTADENKETTLPSTPVDASPALKPSTPAEIEIMTSDVSSIVLDTQQEDKDDLPPAAIDHDSLPPSLKPHATQLSSDSTESPHVKTDVSTKAPAKIEPSTETAVNEAEPVESVEISSAVSEAKVESTKSPAPDAPIADSTVPETPVPTQENGDASAGDKDAVSADQPTSETEESTPQSSSPPRRARPSFLVNGRLTYPPGFMLDMRAKISPRKITDYESSARDGRDIFKGEYGSGGRGDSRRQMGRNSSYSFDMPGSRYSTPGSAPFGPAFGSQHGAGGRGYPSLDLSFARSQPLPPPERKGQPPPMDFDPRGSKTQLPRGRYDHGSGRHSNVDPFIIRPPVEKLKRSEHGWKRNKEADDEITGKVKKVRSLLNKLTLEKFDKIFKQIIEIEINSYELLDRIVKEIFEKTLFEPEFSGMYAELCRQLDIHLADPLRKSDILDPQGKQISFKTILVNNCRDEFTSFAASAESKDEEKEENTSSEQASTEEVKKKTSAEEKEEAELRATKAKRRMLANVRFIGELFLKDLLREKVIHRYCIQRLLKLGIEKKEEDVLEALCKLVSKTGAKMSTNQEAARQINGYFVRFESLTRDFTLPARIRFMLQDLIDQRGNSWKVRRQKASAKTIAEIHQQAKEEERKKQEAQQAARERRGRGGMGGRDRTPQSFVPRMTMASEHRSTSGQTRLDKTLQRQPNRPISSIPGRFSVSLRPGTSASRPGSLRPGGGSFGSFGILSTDKETTGTAPATDPRRAKSGAWQTVSGRSQPPPEKPSVTKPSLMDQQVLKRKAKGTMEEYWANPSITEVREILEDEIKAPNYKGFVYEALIATFSSKIVHQEKSIDLFAGLVGSPVGGPVFCECFSKLVGNLSDMEIDNPRTGEFLGRFIGAVAATSKLDPSDKKDFGLKFLGRGMQKIDDPKRRANLAVHTFAELFGRLTTAIPDQKEREKVIHLVVERLHIDLAADMSLWNPMRGLGKLADMLNQKNVPFLVPYLELEGQLRELIEGKAASEKIESVLQSTSKTANKSLMRLIVRVGMDCLFMSSSETFVESFKTCVGSPVAKAYGTLARDIQLSILLAAQVYIGRSLNFLPPLPDASAKHGGLAFQALNDSGMVESTVFLQWKKDTGDSQHVACKKEMLEQTERFFKRLSR